MARIDDIANRYVDEWARLNPTGATTWGITGYEDRLTDLSSEGFAAQAELIRRTLAQLRTTTPATDAEFIARDAMTDRLSLSLERYETGEDTSEINVVASPIHRVRAAFDLMPTEGEYAAENIASRLAEVPRALEQFTRTLMEAADAGHVASRGQMLAVARQCDTWTDPQGDNFYHGLVRRLDATGALGARLAETAAAANAATRSFGEFLRTELVTRGREKQAIGRERYALASRYFLGAVIDLDESYAWAFDELHRLETQIASVCTEIAGTGASIQEVAAKLDTDPRYRIESKEGFREWMQNLADKAIADLNGTHFDMAEPIRRIEAYIAPTSDGGIYYTVPSEDFSRPGRMWWAVPQGISYFSTWREVASVYHESVPGHHLQVAHAMHRVDSLNRWQRVLAYCSGHGEGWALYSERLMDELGFLGDPADRLGMLDNQAYRAARVIVDIGMHLELAIPKDNPFGFYPGRRWTPDLGWEFMRAHCRVPDENLRFELNRYLGWAGQASSYKLGERIWLQAREDAKKRKGGAFDLKAFHRGALDLGPLGLDALRRQLNRL